MSRSKGIASFSANFEPQVAAPLDARFLCGEKADLTLAATWTANDGGVYAYNGMIVSVHSDPTPANNGIYQLQDADYADINNWQQAGTGGGVTNHANLNADSLKTVNAGHTIKIAAGAQDSNLYRFLTERPKSLLEYITTDHDEILNKTIDITDSGATDHTSEINAFFAAAIANKWKHLVIPPGFYLGDGIDWSGLEDVYISAHGAYFIVHPGIAASADPDLLWSAYDSTTGYTLMDADGCLRVIVDGLTFHGNHDNIPDSNFKWMGMIENSDSVQLKNCRIMKQKSPFVVGNSTTKCGAVDLQIRDNTFSVDRNFIEGLSYTGSGPNDITVAARSPFYWGGRQKVKIRCSSTPGGGSPDKFRWSVATWDDINEQWNSYGAETTTEFNFRTASSGPIIQDFLDFLYDTEDWTDVPTQYPLLDDGGDEYIPSSTPDFGGGLSVVWDSTTGHTIDDYWEFEWAETRVAFFWFQDIPGGTDSRRWGQRGNYFIRSGWKAPTCEMRGPGITSQEGFIMTDCHDSTHPALYNCDLTVMTGNYMDSLEIDGGKDNSIHGNTFRGGAAGGLIRILTSSYGTIDGLLISNNIVEQQSYKKGVDATDFNDSIIGIYDPGGDGLSNVTIEQNILRGNGTAAVGVYLNSAGTLDNIRFSDNLVTGVTSEYNTQAEAYRKDTKFSGWKITQDDATGNLCVNRSSDNTTGRLVFTDDDSNNSDSTYDTGVFFEYNTTLSSGVWVPFLYRGRVNNTSGGSSSLVAYGLTFTLFKDDDETLTGELVGGQTAVRIDGDGTVSKATGNASALYVLASNATVTLGISHLSNGAIISAGNTVSQSVSHRISDASGAGTATNSIGLEIQSITKGVSSNYSCKTSLGTFYIGDDLEVVGDLLLAGGAYGVDVNGDADFRYLTVTWVTGGALWKSTTGGQETGIVFGGTPGSYTATLYINGSFHQFNLTKLNAVMGDGSADGDLYHNHGRLARFLSRVYTTPGLTGGTEYQNSNDYPIDVFVMLTSSSSNFRARGKTGAVSGSLTTVVTSNIESTGSNAAVVRFTVPPGYYWMADVNAGTPTIAYTAILGSSTATDNY